MELNEAYRVLSREESRRNYDHQLHSASPPKSSGSTAEPKYTQQTHRYSTAVLTLLLLPSSLSGREPRLSIVLLLLFSSSWEPPNAQYWAQFHSVRPQGPESRKQQRKHNQRVLGYCLLLMVAGMGLHYVAFRCLPMLPGILGRGWVKRAEASQPLQPMTCILCLSQAKNFVKSRIGALPF